ncbi:ABC-type Fe3+-hydroxamate transport system substrate-binding protein [Paenibacillus sp. DS2015]|uniref:hypothetical protein n=1 Tax=Paenibacillus sp. DS2015 TaxID=3373917 RepID=UPI003D1B7FC8
MKHTTLIVISTCILILLIGCNEQSSKENNSQSLSNHLTYKSSLLSVVGTDLDRVNGLQGGYYHTRVGVYTPEGKEITSVDDYNEVVWNSSSELHPNIAEPRGNVYTSNGKKLYPLQ